MEGRVTMLQSADRMKIGMNFVFFGVDGFEKYRPAVEIILSSMSKTSLIAFTLGINEAICNALRYGNEGLDMSQVKLQVRYNGTCLIAQICSSNAGFDVKSYLAGLNDSTAEWWKDLRKRKRGRGLWLMLSGSQRVIFNASGNKVILVLNTSCKETDEANLLSKVTVLKKNCKEVDHSLLPTANC
jgi:anti-sigma regulatory factor (Ser/Thr protein kinase)